MRVLSLTVLALLGTVLSASGQITTGTVSGTVTDSTGGVVPGASVMLTSETQANKIGPVVTNAEGVYVFPNIIADTYSVDVTLSGFKPVSRTGIRVSGGARVAVAIIQLEAGGLTEKVDVKAEAPLIKAASGDRTSLIEKTQLDSLPISSHAFLDFVGFQTGINSGSMSPGSQQRRVGGGASAILTARPPFLDGHVPTARRRVPGPGGGSTQHGCGLPRGE
jgi:hypothetical protein